MAKKLVTMTENRGFHVKGKIPQTIRFLNEMSITQLHGGKGQTGFEFQENHPFLALWANLTAIFIANKFKIKMVLKWP